SSFRSSERRRRMAQPAVIGAVIGSVIGLVAPIAPGSVERGGNEYVSRQRLGSRARLMFGHRLHRIGGLAGSNPREPQLCRLSTSKSPTLCSPCVWSLARRTMRYWERRRRKLSEPLGGTMASQKPIEANQANALSSTGPKTTDGKVIASKNSF